MSFYNHRLHNEYEQKINTEINIRIKLFKELELYKKIIQDETNYPEDQESAYYFHYPLAGNRTAYKGRIQIESCSRKTISVGRMVALTFLAENGVDYTKRKLKHLDNNVDNNNVENLKWM
jgi:hypothetical protein